MQLILAERLMGLFGSMSLSANDYYFRPKKWHSTEIDAAVDYSAIYWHEKRPSCSMHRQGFPMLHCQKIFFWLSWPPKKFNKQSCNAER